MQVLRASRSCSDELRLDQSKWYCDLKPKLLVLKETLGSGATFGWLMGYRRLLRDYELLPQTSETFIYLAIIHYGQAFGIE